MSRTYAYGIRELLTDARVVAIHGGRRANEFAETFNLAVEPTLAGLVGRDDVDVVFLGSPTQTHRDQTILVVTLGLLAALTVEGWPVQPGDLGENLTISGIRESELRPGVRLHLGEASLAITKPCDPCFTDLAESNF